MLIPKLGGSPPLSFVALIWSELLCGVGELCGVVQVSMSEVCGVRMGSPGPACFGGLAAKWLGVAGELQSGGELES